jgi:Ca-activated chloride channel homolog
MKIDANDARWTAYALGEITDEREKAELEQMLDEAPELRKRVEEVQSAAALLRRELQAEPELTLTPEQRRKIDSSPALPKTWFGMNRKFVMACAAVWILLISFVAVRQFRLQQTKAREALEASERMRRSQPALPQHGREPGKPAVLETIAPNVAAIEQNTAAPKSVPPQADNKSVLAGNVTDMTGAAVPGVQVSAPAPYLVLGTLSSGVPANSFMPPKTGAIAGGVAGGVVSGFFGGVLMPSPPPPPMRLDRDLLPIQRQLRPFNTETYDSISDNKFLDVAQNPLSTFSIDVDTASYSNMRRFLDMGKLPPKDSIRIEELVNYFNYDYKGPKDGKPFAANVELTEAPWKPEHQLLRIGIKGRQIESDKRPAGNLVFLLDVSGSMAAENKLPLVKDSMRLLMNQLGESDRIAIVVYAGETDLLLSSTSGDQKEKILRAIDSLHAGGSTNGASGIQLAYRTAQENIIPGGINRVILATDGDFNVGITNRGDLTRLIEEKAKSGIYLSALGFGMGNYKDATLELLAKNGHGNYAYIDTLNEAKKVLVEQMNSTLIPIAKDVKIQVEFNPRLVSAYRLIGYEDRLMAKEDFNDDTKDAGVIGAGHAVTALYELVPAGAAVSNPPVDPLKYQRPLQASSAANSSELATIKIRSKDPDKDQSVLSEFAVKESRKKFGEASEDFKFAAAVAAYGMVLRDSPHKGTATLDHILDWAREGQGADKHGYRQEFIRLIHRAISISD